MLKVAITGNIAAGKSQVESIFARNYPVYDADKIAHKFLGNVDRKALGEKVFADKKARKELEAQIHPKVRAEILEIFKKGANKDIIFVSVPLLFEAGFQDIFDKVIFVSANENLRLERLMKRNGLTKEQALLRIRAQEVEENKLKKSDYVIFNNSSIEELEKQVGELLSAIIYIGQ